MKRIGAAVALSLLAACSSAPPFPVETFVKEWADYLNQDHILVPGDEITITAFQMPELTQEVVISPNGMVNLKRLPEPVRAVGIPVARFRSAVEQAYAQALPSVEVSVNLTTPNIKNVFVGGRVREPKAVPWDAHLTVTQAIAAAGSFLLEAKSSDVLVVRPTPGTHRARTVRVNVDAIIYGKQLDFPLLPGDVVWAQPSGVGSAGDFVELYIRRLLPINAIPVL